VVGEAPLVRGAVAPSGVSAITGSLSIIWGPWTVCARAPAASDPTCLCVIRP
jgi:hypothetical protein